MLWDTSVVAAVLPFNGWKRNLLPGVISTLGVLQCLGLLAMVQMGNAQISGSQINLDHSTASVEQAQTPTSALTGQSDKAVQLIVAFAAAIGWLLVLLCFVQRRVLGGCLRVLGSWTRAVWQAAV